MNAVEPSVGHDVSAFVGSLYNAMPEVMEADSRVRSGRWIDRARIALGPIFVKHGVQDICGINLLHVHWLVEPGEIPHQTRQRYEGGFELVTRPTAPAPELIAPSSWVLQRQAGARRFVPFEFSADDEVVRSAQILRSRPDFFAETGEAMEEHGLQRHFGLCVVRRGPLGPDDQAVPVEVSSVRGRLSVVRPMSLDDEQRRSFIQTSWTFVGGDPGSEGKPPVPPPRCRIGGFCERDTSKKPPTHKKIPEHDPD